jgi:hypothetical protein
VAVPRAILIHGSGGDHRGWALQSPRFPGSLAVDLPGHPEIRRPPAVELAPDSDLGDRLVTVEVGQLADEEIETALAAGLAEAERMRTAGTIEAAVLCLEGHIVTAGPLRPRAALGDAS